MPFFSLLHLFLLTHTHRYSRIHAHSHAHTLRYLLSFRSAPVHLTIGHIDFLGVRASAVDRIAVFVTLFKRSSGSAQHFFIFSLTLILLLLFLHYLLPTPSSSSSSSLHTHEYRHFVSVLFALPRSLTLGHIDFLLEPARRR